MLSNRHEINTRPTLSAFRFHAWDQQSTDLIKSNQFSVLQKLNEHNEYACCPIGTKLSAYKDLYTRPGKISLYYGNETVTVYSFSLFTLGYSIYIVYRNIGIK